MKVTTFLAVVISCAWATNSIAVGILRMQSGDTDGAYLMAGIASACIVFAANKLFLYPTKEKYRP